MLRSKSLFTRGSILLVASTHVESAGIWLSSKVFDVSMGHGIWKKKFLNEILPPSLYIYYLRLICNLFFN
jgi:hypothetical protein